MLFFRGSCLLTFFYEEQFSHYFPVDILTEYQVFDMTSGFACNLTPTFNEFVFIVYNNLYRLVNKQRHSCLDYIEASLIHSSALPGAAVFYFRHATHLKPLCSNWISSYNFNSVLRNPPNLSVPFKSSWQGYTLT